MVFHGHYMVLERNNAPRTLKVGSTMLHRETRVLFCRVVGYFFGLGYVKKPLYIVRLESDVQPPLGTRLHLIDGDFAQHIDEKDLFKIFPDPARSDIVEEEGEVDDCQSTTTKRRRMGDEQETINSNHCDSEPNLGPQGSPGQALLPSQASMMYNQQQQQLMIPELNQPNQMGSVPTLLPSQASMMYNQEQQLMRPEINQPNQMRSVPTLLPSQAPMMYNQQLSGQSGQITEPNLGAQVSTMFVGQQNLRQPFGMCQQPSPMVYNPHEQFMRHEMNQPNQMGTVPSPLPVQAPVMYNQPYGSHITEPNLGATMFVGQNNPNQPFDMRQQPFQSAAAPVMYNQQQQSMGPLTNQQNQMSTMRMFNAGQSSYRGRGGRHSRARGLGKRGRD